MLEFNINITQFFLLVLEVLELANKCYNKLNLIPVQYPVFKY